MQQQKDYYTSDEVELFPDIINDEIRPKQFTIKEQIDTIKEQIKQLQNSIDLEKSIAIRDPIAYTNLLIKNMEQFKNQQLNARIHALSKLCPSAEKEIIIKCKLPSDTDSKKFQLFEQQIAQLEQIIGKPPQNYDSNIIKDLLEIQEQLKTLKIADYINEVQAPQNDAVTPLYNQIQLFVGISDLLPKISSRLEQLKNAHLQSANFPQLLQKYWIRWPNNKNK
ncbi:hypothetical protein pb186bvf_006362 [Paramecium bursaria]